MFLQSAGMSARQQERYAPTALKLQNRQLTVDWHYIGPFTQSKSVTTASAMMALVNQCIEVNLKRE